jgi:hypothetical protein
LSGEGVRRETETARDRRTERLLLLLEILDLLRNELNQLLLKLLQLGRYDLQELLKLEQLLLLKDLQLL